MLHRFDLRVLTALCGAIGIIAACTTSDGGGTKTGGTSGSSGGTSGSSGSGTSSGGTSGSTGDSGSAQCAGKAGQACFDCCGETDTTFAEAEKAYDNCACVQTLCNTECGVWCAGRASNPLAEPGEACEACLESEAMSTACDPQYIAKCQSDPNCKKVADCVQNANCLGDDDDDDGG